MTLSLKSSHVRRYAEVGRPLWKTVGLRGDRVARSRHGRAHRAWHAGVIDPPAPGVAEGRSEEAGAIEIQISDTNDQFDEVKIEAPVSSV